MKKWKLDSLEEAKQFFLENHKGEIFCHKRGELKDCDSYEEAEKFYKSN